MPLPPDHFNCAECGDIAPENEKERRCITCPGLIEQGCLDEAEVRIKDNKRRYRCKTCRLDMLTTTQLEAIVSRLLEESKEFKSAVDVRAHLREKGALPKYVASADIVTPQELQFEYSSEEEEEAGSDFQPDESSSDAEEDGDEEPETEGTRKSARKRGPAESLEVEARPKRSRTGSVA